MDPKRIAEIIAALAGDDAASVSSEDIAAALAAIKEQATEFATSTPSADTVASLTTLLDQRNVLLAAQTERTAAGDTAQAHAAALAELDGTHDPKRDDNQPDDKAAPVPPTGDEPEGGKAKEGEDEKPKPKRAARTRQLGDLDRDDVPAEPSTAGTVTTRTLVQGGVPGHNPGDALPSAAALAKAFVDKAKALSSPSAAGRHDVARIEYQYPPERILGHKASAEANTEKINAATSPQAITAAGGLCLPLEVRYDIETIGVTDRPVKGALSAFQVERGGLQFRAPFDALAMATGLGVWTQADDIAADPEDPETLKSCLEVTCPGVLEASIYSTYMCLEFANMTARFDTEWVSATNDSAQVAWARFAENQLLSRLAAGSKAINGIHQLGAVRDILLNFDRIIAYYRNRHRLNDAVPLRTVMPRFVIEMLRSDLAMQMTNASPGELFAIAQATLEAWFGTRGVNVTWHLDGLAGGTQNGVVFPAQTYADLAAGATVPAYPTAIDALLFREGDWLFLDGGTLDLGLVRDSNLNMRNRYQTFIETFEGVAFVGKESLRIKLPIVPSGASSGTIDPHAIDATLPVVTP